MEHKMAGLYIHIPFCKQRCKYCAFYSSTLYNIKERYTDALCKELEMRRNYAGEEEISTIYFGGGTPSTMPFALLQKITDAIYDNYNISADPEITIECNPDDLTPEFLAKLKQLPFNRISMGIQSFDDTQLKRLGRRHNAEKARQAVANARAAGYGNISIDLIFALPGSTKESWQDDLDTAIAVKPDHLSAYNLTYEEGTPLYRALERGEFQELSEEENVEQFQMLIKSMKAAGYRHYEISNFAIPGRESRHNSSYWNDTPYIGCGAAAHSYNGISRQWNISNIETYIKSINSGIVPSTIENLSNEDCFNEYLMTALRTRRGLETEYLTSRHPKLWKATEPKLSTYINKGLMEQTHKGYHLNHNGMLQADAIAAELFM
jgi:oxygen-independent coproporphyrinogen-3 oxidase